MHSLSQATGRAQFSRWLSWLTTYSTTNILYQMEEKDSEETQRTKHYENERTRRDDDMYEETQDAWLNQRRHVW